MTETVDTDAVNTEGTPHNSSRPSRGSQLISRLLPPAVRLWVHTQVDHIDDLEFRIDGRDREILSGYIPQVVVAAQQAVYRGIHLSQIQVTAADIRFNLGQVLRGKPLRLLQAFPIMGQMKLSEADLNASLQAPLLAEGLSDFFAKLFQSRERDGAVAQMLGEIQPALPTEGAPDQPLNFRNPQIRITPNALTLSLSPTTPNTGVSVSPIIMRTGLILRDGHILMLRDPQWLPDMTSEQGVPLTELQDFQLDLGSEVDIQTCTLTDQYMVLHGRVNVIPAD